MLSAMSKRVQATIRVPKTAELMAAKIRGEILAGTLRPGDRLPSEDSLMSSFGVSRPTLREAIRLLEADELLDVRRGARGGAVVRRQSALPALRTGYGPGRVRRPRPYAHCGERTADRTCAGSGGCLTSPT
jgi:GntR family transcriptional repressor for pyruvate dehydrogenase complex